MQKKLIALAVAGLVSTGAYAQSSAVTVYGVADLSFDSVSSSGPAATKTGNYTRVTSNNSYIGFKGTEDLGNGLKALFQFETSVAADGSTGSTFGANRDTFAGLEGAFGSIKLGTLTTPTRALGSAIDVNAGYTSIGDSKALTNLSGFDTRQNNTALYSSPSFSGFNVAAAYVSGENKSGTPSAQNSSAWDLGATYNNGPILAGLTYANARTRNGIDAQVKNTRIAGAYDFGVGSVRALWNSTKNQNNIGGNAKQNVWGLGGTFNAAPNGKVIAQFYKANNVNGTSNTGAKLYEVGYEHSFSKRTMLKVVYAKINNDASSAFNFASGVNGVANDVDPSGFQVGIRHAF